MEDNSIGSSGDKEARYRELNVTELTQHSFSDYFRLSFTVRMDRDEALALSRKLELIINESLNRDCRVYIGVLNH